MGHISFLQIRGKSMLMIMKCKKCSAKTHFRNVVAPFLYIIFLPLFSSFSRFQMEVKIKCISVIFYYFSLHFINVPVALNVFHMDTSACMLQTQILSWQTSAVTFFWAVFTASTLDIHSLLGVKMRFFILRHPQGLCWEVRS